MIKYDFLDEIYTKYNKLKQIDVLSNIFVAKRLDFFKYYDVSYPIIIGLE